MQEVILETWYNPLSKSFIDPTEHVNRSDDASPTLVQDFINSGVQLIRGPYIAPISRNSIRADQELQSASPLSWFFSLRDALEPVLPYFDYVIADTNPSAGCLTGLCLCTSPYFLVPLTPEQLSIQGMLNLLRTVKDAKRASNPDLKLAGIVFTRVANYKGYELIMTSLRKELAQGLQPSYPDMNFSFFDTGIQQSKDGVDATNDRSVAVLHRPNSPHAISYWCLLAEVLNQVGGPAREKMPEVLRAIQQEEERKMDAAKQRKEAREIAAER